MKRIKSFTSLTHAGALERDADWLERRKLMIYTDAQRERFCDWVSRLMADGVSEDNARETAFKGIFK